MKAAMLSFLLLGSSLGLAGCSESGTSPTAASASTDGADRTVTTTRSTASSDQSPESIAPSTSLPAPLGSSVGTDPSRPSSAPTSIASGIEAQLAERVRGMFSARLAANVAPAPNPDDPRLADWAMGEALAELKAEATQRRDAGQAVRSASPSMGEIRVGFVHVEGTAASVSVCRVDDGVVFEPASGRVVDDAVVTNNYQVDLVVVDGVWKVGRVTRVQQWEGVAGCALAAADFPY